MATVRAPLGVNHSRDIVRHAVLAVAFATLAACAAANPVQVSPAPDPNAGVGIRFVARINGDADMQGYAETIPITAYFRARGNVIATFRPLPGIGQPYVHFELRGDATVTPVPGLEPEAERALRSGEAVIVRVDIPVDAPPTPPPAAGDLR